MNGHGARYALDLDALARQFVERPPVALECRMHGRHLPDVAGEARQHARNIGHFDVDRSRGSNAALGVAGVGGDPQLQDSLVSLVGIEQVGRKLRGFAETQRQKAAGQRIEGAGIAALGRREETAHFLQGIVRAQPERLVEQPNAIDLFPCLLHFRLHREIRWPATRLQARRRPRWPGRSAVTGSCRARSSCRRRNAVRARCGYGSAAPVRGAGNQQRA